jgi:ATP dependent DNA ligase domain
VAERFVVPRKPGNAGGRKGPQFKTDATSGEGFGDWATYQLRKLFRKFDGYRVQVHLNKGKKRVFIRNGLDWTKRFSVIAGALDIPGQAILDGEVVVIH